MDSQLYVRKNPITELHNPETSDSCLTNCLLSVPSVISVPICQPKIHCFRAPASLALSSLLRGVPRTPTKHRMKGVFGDTLRNECKVFGSGNLEEATRAPAMSVLGINVF